MTLTAKELASILNGREYGCIITKEESNLAKINNLVVVYGASDDLMEFEGAIRDEVGCYEGTTVHLNKNGIFDNEKDSYECRECDLCQKELKTTKTIESIWGKNGYSWQYKTEIPHETFDIFEDGDTYCKGIVFSLKDLAEDTGKISDGYHTFEELYYHRMVLFSIICNQNKDKAWKSGLHADGTMYYNHFIVGITTPEGNYSYHFHNDSWDLFDVTDLYNAPELDGHKPADIKRLYSILK
jgi:hypothetical protein